MPTRTTTAGPASTASPGSGPAQKTQLDSPENRERAAVTTGPGGVPSVPESVTHVLVGYSPVVLGKLDSSLPEDSVLVLEEPDVIEARVIADLSDRHRCVAALLPAPSQDEKNPHRLVDAVSRPPRVQVVVPVVEYGVVGAAVLAEAWGLPGAGLKAAVQLRDKALLRTALASTGVGQPAWSLADTAQDVADFRELHGGECVLKPANRQASLGVQMLGPDTDVRAAWDHVVTSDEPQLRARYHTDSRFLVEERVRGPEVSVEALVHEGVVGFLNITAKSLQDAAYPVAIGHRLPAALPEATVAALREGTESLVTATGFRSGCLHSEWILAGDRPYFIECQGRLPGGGIRVLIDLAYETDLLQGMLTVLQGEPVEPRAAVQGAAVRLLVAAQGTVEAISGVEAAGAADGVQLVQLLIAPGAVVDVTTSSWDRAGMVIATGTDAAAAARNAERGAALVDIRTTESTTEGPTESTTGDTAEDSAGDRP
ncbi:hypothetical protein Pth03_27610 [Planotetraspora thailandica]|uniref:ATP-grasp domain-containing protein n=1 Tax=Planotetraspora thailandica TaxID=487172 RepID=A0A8J3V2K8_9ACTN|nr:ATP-grasp domain-containing protein [Planotetraspora thailandica]GII54372.1 hypothetical protein Pth03_27610 [Planotetraspora thailandica]